MTNLRDHQAGYSLVNELYRVQHDAPGLNKLGRLFGANPMADGARPWFLGLIGETRVGEELDALKEEGYTVLHSVPVGKKGSDIDHVVISPVGLVYVINTKNHYQKKIWVGGTVLVDGQKTDYIRNSKFEADRTVKILSKATSSQPDVEPLLVFVSPASIDEKENAAVTALTQDNVVEYIKDQEKAYTDKFGLYRFNYDMEKVVDPAFWSPAYVDHVDLQEERFKWFADFRRDVARQYQKKIGWRFGAFVVIVGGGLGIYTHSFEHLYYFFTH